MNDKPDTLEAVLAQCWSLLGEGVMRSDSAMRTPVLGSLGEAGCELRTVILRSCNYVSRIIQCHTDSRSAKVSEMRQSSRVQWVFYHPVERVQLRATGMARVERDTERVDTIWGEQPPRSRRVYQVEHAPGTPSDTPTGGLSALMARQEPDIHNTESGRANFAVIECRIDILDWLHLGVGINTRARFTWDGDKLAATWCTP